jgi:hypothetical protein
MVHPTRADAVAAPREATPAIRYDNLVEAASCPGDAIAPALFVRAKLSLNCLFAALGFGVLAFGAVADDDPPGNAAFGALAIAG